MFLTYNLKLAICVAKKGINGECNLNCVRVGFPPLSWPMGQESGGNFLENRRHPPLEDDA